MQMMNDDSRRGAILSDQNIAKRITQTLVGTISDRQPGPNDQTGQKSLPNRTDENPARLRRISRPADRIRGWFSIW
jgi:hypothetical protein